MISHCDSCRWVTADIKTVCPDCGRGIDLDFDHPADYFLAQGYRKFKEPWESEEEDNSDEINGADTAVNGKNTAVGNNVVFNDNFADFCGTSAIDESAESIPAKVATETSAPRPIITPVRKDTEKTAFEKDELTDFLAVLRSSPNSPETNHIVSLASSSEKGDFEVKIDSSAIDSFRNSSSDFGADADSVITINTGSSGATAATNTENGAEYGDFGGSGRSVLRNTSFENEYERQRRAALARERRQAFFYRLRSINPRTVLRVVAVLAIIGVGAYIWSMRDAIIEGISEFLVSLIGPAVLIIIIGSVFSSLFRRRR